MEIYETQDSRLEFTTRYLGYTDETKRLFSVLEIRLSNREYLAGPGQGKFSIADIKAFPWVRIHEFSGIPSLDVWPNVKVNY